MIELDKQLLNIGLKPGMSIEIHSSLKCVGQDIDAEDIIDSLKKIITESGNIVMATFLLSRQLELSEDDKKMGILKKCKWLPEDHHERTDMGIVSDQFRFSENVQTGIGQHRMSAWGKDSAEIVKDFNFLINNDGYALLMGVDIRRLTPMHYVESCIPGDAWALLFNKFSSDIEKKYNLDAYFITAEMTPKYHKGWLRVQSIAEDKKLITHGKIGNANCMFFNIKQITDIYEDAIKTDINKLFGIDYQPTTVSNQ